MFRLIIAGGRDFVNQNLAFEKIDYLIGDNDKSQIVIVCGMARGADTLGLHYAEHNDLEILKFHAKWDVYGKRAGYMRNEEMAKNADGLLAFWDGSSRGTMHMINLARQYKLQVAIYNYITGEWSA
jgi:hypothetical protein